MPRTSMKYALQAISMLTMLIVCAFAASCTDDTERDIYGTSKLEPTAQVDATVYTVEGVDHTGSLLPFVPVPEDLSLTLTRTDGSYSHTWESIADYSDREPLMPGFYNVEVSYGSEYDEGPDSPYFYGISSVNISSTGETVSVSVTAKLANALWRVNYTDAFTDYFAAAKAILHSQGGGYIEVLPEHTVPVYLRPGPVKVMMQIEMPDGKNVEFLAASVAEALAAHLYSLTVDLRFASDGTPQIILSFDESTATDDVTVSLTPQFLSASAPVLTPQGFTGASDIEIAEGTTPEHPISVSVDKALASHLLLTTKAPSLIEAGWPAEIDMMRATDEQLNAMRRLGLTITDDAAGNRVYDFTAVAANLRATGADNSLNSFSWVATSPQGRMAGPLVLNIEVRPVDIHIVSVSPVVIGINKAQARVISPDANLERNITVETRNSADEPWQPSSIASVEQDADRPGRWIVTFDVPQSTRAEVEMRILYCGQVKATYTLKREAPQYTVDIDAFALLALVRVQAATPELTELVVSLATVYIDGKPTLQVTRHPLLGYITVGALTANRTYRLSTTLFDAASAAAHPDSFTPDITFATENNAGVPNGDFDEIEAGAIKYTNMPAGGRYSQNIVEIYNRQNYHNFNLSVPKKWANTNAKTFCGAATNHNTWYMQPSVFTTDIAASGPYAAVVRSVGWDLAGPSIPDYRQPGQPYTDYSCAIPQIAHRAAGKLFIGSYRFDPATLTEQYEQGVDFRSRPSALNGYYAFTPSTNDIYDQGLVIVEVLGELDGAEIVIASGRKNLSAASTYTAFSVPLSYQYFGLKATRLKIMFASSSHIGSIDEESARVVTFSDPSVSMAIGNKLTVDNLTFSY